MRWTRSCPTLPYRWHPFRTAHRLNQCGSRSAWRSKARLDCPVMLGFRRLLIVVDQSISMLPRSIREPRLKGCNAALPSSSVFPSLT